MSHWTSPLTQSQVETYCRAHEHNGPCTVIDGPIGPMVRVHCLLNTDPSYHNKIYYCGGDCTGFIWLLEDQFLQMYPDFSYKIGVEFLPEPEFDLDDMELAEIIMEELK